MTRRACGHDFLCGCPQPAELSPSDHALIERVTAHALVLLQGQVGPDLQSDTTIWKQTVSAIAGMIKLNTGVSAAHTFLDEIASFCEREKRSLG